MDDGSDSSGPARDQAVEILWHRPDARLTRLAAGLTGDRGVAEEVVQDAFAGLLPRWRHLRDPDAAGAYLRCAVVNGARRRWRRGRLAGRTAATWASPAQAPGPGAEVEARADMLAALARPRHVRHQPAVRRVTAALAAQPGFLAYMAGRNLGGPVMSRDAIMATSVVGTRPVGTATVAASGPGLALASPAVSPDRKQIAYVQGATGHVGAFAGQGDLVIADVNGAHPHVMTSGDQDTNPVWSPSGRQIAFMRDMHIWIMSATGAHPHSLDASLPVNGIAWSPDGRQLAVGSGQGFSRIAIVTIATGQYRWFAPASAHQYDPSWSADGRQLVYTTDAGTLFVARINGTGAHQITTCTRSCTEDDWPVWSPDGKTIAFDLDIGKSVQVAVVPASGGRVTMLTKGPQQHESPSW